VRSLGWLPLNGGWWFTNGGWRLTKQWGRVGAGLTKKTKKRLSKDSPDPLGTLSRARKPVEQWHILPTLVACTCHHRKKPQRTRSAHTANQIQRSHTEPLLLSDLGSCAVVHRRVSTSICIETAVYGCCLTYTMVCCSWVLALGVVKQKIASML
jgi:hypothetical protein